MQKIKIITYSPHANNKDHSDPCGAKHDNHSNATYIKQICDLFTHRPIYYMDLGCAGCQTVIDMNNMGHIAVGVEGCGYEQIMKKSNQPIKDNWKQYYNKCLFGADIGEPFVIANENNEIIKFDIITAWDFLEHPLEKQIPTVLENIKKHLKEDGWLIYNIALTSGPWHNCVKPIEWWKDIFNKHGLQFCNTPLTSTPREENTKTNQTEFAGACRHAE
jgi:hypothetical protein